MKVSEKLSDDYRDMPLKYPGTVANAEAPEDRRERADWYLSMALGCLLLENGGRLEVKESTYSKYFRENYDKLRVHRFFDKDRDCYVWELENRETGEKPFSYREGQ